MPTIKRRFTVDFSRLKTQFGIEDVLKHFDVPLAGTGRQRRGRCPIHSGDNETSFSVNVEANSFHCFSCGASGNHLDLIAQMEECSIKDAARKAVAWFGLDAGDEPSERTPNRVRKEKTPTPKADESDQAEASASNEPLAFTLKLDATHPYLADRGLDAETIERFGLGFCSRGTMKDRIAIPIRNPDGELVAYAGRWVGDGEPPEGEGKYKLPKGFLKSLELFADWTSLRADGDARTIVLVEGFFPCMLFEQWGAFAISTMGSSMSPEQFALIRAHTRPGDRFVILYDGDKAGREGAREAASLLATLGFTRTIELPDGKQPDNYTFAEYQEMYPELFPAAQ